MAPVYTCTEWQWAVSSVGELTTSKTLLSRFGIPVESMNHLVDLWLDARTSFLLQVNWLDNHLKGGQFSGFPAFRPFATALVCSLLLFYISSFHIPIARLRRFMRNTDGCRRSPINNKVDHQTQWSISPCFGHLNSHPPWLDAPLYAHQFEQEGHQRFCVPNVGLGIWASRPLEISEPCTSRSLISQTFVRAFPVYYMPFAPMFLMAKTQDPPWFLLVTWLYTCCRLLVITPLCMSISSALLSLTDSCFLLNEVSYNDVLAF